MTPSTSLIIPRKWTSCWITKESKLQVYIPCSLKSSGRWPSILRKLQLLKEYIIKDMHISSSALLSQWNQNFWWTVGITFSPFHDWCIEQCPKPFSTDFSWSDANRVQVIMNKIHLSTEWDCFFLRIPQTLFFKSFRKRFKAKSYISTA